MPETNAAVLAACALPEPFTVNDVEVVIESLAFRPPNDLVVRLTASREGLLIYDPNEEFIFRNPPNMVPAGTTTVAHPRWGGIEVETFEVDPAGALVAIVSDTLRTVLGQN